MTRVRTPLDIKFESNYPYWRMDMSDEYPPSWTCNMGWHHDCGGRTYFTDGEGQDRHKPCPCPHHKD